jgi:Tfp pilus assembly protein PilW
MMSLPDLKDERGTTMAELVVGMAMGSIVMIGLTWMIIATLHGNARVDARVEASDNARIAIAAITEELHSACISPQIAPIREKSSANTLVFWHAAAGQSTQVQPNPVKTTITYSSGTLTQTDYAVNGGTSPKWTFSTTGSVKTILTNVAPATGTGVFSYFRYENGGLKQITTTELSEADAATVILVRVGIKASPKSTPVADTGAPASIYDSATLRLTPPSYNEKSSALPCQ